jgi:hypothetical protein
VVIDFPIDGLTGLVSINAATDVDIDQPVLHMHSGNALNVTAGRDVNVNAQIDGRGGAAGGAVNLAAHRNVQVNSFILTNNGAINLTATTGSASVAPGMALFAGAGPISLTAANSISTAPMITTGALNVQSTAGSVNVNTAIDGTTGPVTLTAAAAVNINQAIANTRSDAPLTVTAGTDINVGTAINAEALIDGRDANAASPGGTVTMSAGQNLNLNQSIVTENADISLTAQNGTLAMAAGKGLFAGSAPISVTSGATLTPGILSTTGAQNITSNAGAININTPIDDMTGATTITAATAVNVNQTITNLKTGNNLAITAGTDLNVNAQIDGRDGVAAGGSVILTAGNDLNVNEHITTNDGAINLTTTTGSVVLFPFKQVRAGSAPITIVSGGNFSTGAAPLQPVPTPPPGTVTTEEEGAAYVREYLKQFVQLVTTGALNITSTNGDVNVTAPISDVTGAVTITAGNAINVNHRISSNNQPITLNAGPGATPVERPRWLMRRPFARFPIAP